MASAFAIAIWVVPAAILSAQRSRLAAVATLVIPATLWLQRRNRPLLAAICLAVLAELTTTLVMDEETLAPTILALCAAVLLWKQTRLSRNRPSFLLTGLAAILTMATLIRYLAHGSGDSAAGPSESASSETAPAKDSGVNAAVGGDYAGVILIPKAEKHVTLVPPLPAMNSSLFTKPEDHPLTIPFFGVYWFFRPPDRRPPPNSVTIRGTPEDIRFRSVGRAPLKMEAHQNLGKLIDVGCCSRIQVAIRNLESHVKLTTVELMLANSSEPDSPPASLGPQPVDATQHQTLTFPMRTNLPFRQFDELTVRVNRGWIGAQQSARISVERFVLIPRGR